VRFHASFNIKHDSTQYKKNLIFAGWFAIAKISTSLMYISLPIIIATQYNVARAGILIACANTLSLFISPLWWAIADKKTNISSIRIYCCLFVLWSLIRLIGQQGLRVLILTCLCYFSGYGFDIREPYLLQHSQHGKAGKSFGLFIAIIAMGTLIATLIFPFFATHAYPRMLSWSSSIWPYFFSSHFIFNQISPPKHQIK